MKKFNRAVWLKDLRETESQISALKKQIHQPHTVQQSEYSFTYGLVKGPDGPVRVSTLVGKLQQLTATATALYALRRQVKFKMHPVNKAWVWKEYKNYMGGVSRFVSFAYPPPWLEVLFGERERELNERILQHFDTSKYFDEVGAGPMEQLVGDAKEPEHTP